MAEFTLIKGGKEKKPSLNYKFVSASVTDTRLMGVLGLRVHWLSFESGNEDLAGNLYMFFYYDIEEIGLDSLSVYELNGDDEVALATKSCFGGLGATLYPISEKEAVYLIQSFTCETKKKKQPLPDNAGLLDTILQRSIDMSKEEILALNKKMCTKLVNDYTVVNYYLMRSFGKDFAGADLLKDPNISSDYFDDISLNKHATFLKNSIEKFYNNDGRISYLSESLVETENSHFIVISDIRVSSKKVIEAKKLKQFEISIAEASMLLARGEYVTVYKVLCPMEVFDVDFAQFSIGTTKTAHESGDMYMEFKPDNSHVDTNNFRLYDDISALFFVTDFGELIVSAYSIEDIMYAEDRIENSNISIEVSMDMKFQLANSIMYDFAESGCASFKEFLQSLE